jgi:NAD+ kinase
MIRPRKRTLFPRRTTAIVVLVLLLLTLQNASMFSLVARNHGSSRHLHLRALSDATDTTSINENVTANTNSNRNEQESFSNERINTENRLQPKNKQQRQMDLMWCAKDYCKEAVRETVVGKHNQILLNGPATGQVAYHWTTTESTTTSSSNNADTDTTTDMMNPSVLFLIRPGSNDELLQVAAAAIAELARSNIHVLLNPSCAAHLRTVMSNPNDVASVRLFEKVEAPGNHGVNNAVALEQQYPNDPFRQAMSRTADNSNDDVMPDLICTLGGDGLLMHASMMFQGPVPPILCVSGGSLGFLTPFFKQEMVDAIQLALGLLQTPETSAPPLNPFPPGTMPREPLSSPTKQGANAATDSAADPVFGAGYRICLSIRMRLECTVFSREGSARARYNVLNEVVIDRGSSPYLAALECFCDDVHLTTVQADGVIFATPTGSTAYSLAAGSSVVHPAVPCILVTPICPHVLSFRSMVFPDHVVLRCYVPDDARATASVAFDGKHRQELLRGDSVQIRMSPYPVPTINRQDHSSDWLESLKRSFNFNTRARQQPL